jgi:N-acetyl-gamma-glutamylphosphate reductase
MKKKIALAAFLAVPGSFAILALACLHPVLRRSLARAAGLEPVLANVSRQVVLLALVYHLNLHHRHHERALRACQAHTGDCNVLAQ